MRSALRLRATLPVTGAPLMASLSGASATELLLMVIVAFQLEMAISRRNSLSIATVEVNCFNGRFIAAGSAFAFVELVDAVVVEVGAGVVVVAAALVLLPAKML